MKKLIQLKVSEEEYGKLAEMAGDVPLTRFILKKMLRGYESDLNAAEEFFGKDQVRWAEDASRAMNKAVNDDTSAAHAKWSRPIEVIPIDPTIEAQRQAKLECLRQAQEMLIAKQKKPGVRRGASSSGYKPRPRGVDYNPRGDYDEPVIDVDA